MNKQKIYFLNKLFIMAYNIKYLDINLTEMKRNFMENHIKLLKTLKDKM